jgi:short-subunit dehydrogenase
LRPSFEGLRTSGEGAERWKVGILVGETRGEAMKEIAGRTAVVTGASRGIGVFVARALSEQGMNLVLAARTTDALEELRSQLVARGKGGVVVAPTDISKREDCRRLVETAQREFGAIDVLVNNAGIENIYPYHKLSLDEIDEVIDVNLRGTMCLTWMALPGMLERRRGHIVNMSSLAGKVGPACCEVYAATKAGLIGFTQSLRGSYRGDGVSASVICPGFVDAGMYSRVVEEHGLEVPKTLGVAKPEAVADAVVKSIVKDVAEVIVNPMPVRVLLGMYSLAPGITERVSGVFDANKMLRDQAALRQKQRQAPPN